MLVRSVDPRDVSQELDNPGYRIYFHVGGGDGLSWASDEYEISGADVDEVLDWANAELTRRRGNLVLYAATPGTESQPGLRLVRLLGEDPNAAANPAAVSRSGTNMPPTDALTAVYEDEFTNSGSQLSRSVADVAEHSLRMRLHVLVGIDLAVHRYQEVLGAINLSADSAEAATAVGSLLEVDENQAKAVLGLRWDWLTATKVQEIADEVTEMRKSLGHNS